MTRSLAVAILFLLASIALWPQSEPAKPNPDTPSPSSAPSSSSPPSSAPSSSPALPDSTKIELVKGERAIYPLAAEEQKLQGQVWVRLHISEAGDIEGVDVLSGDPILAAAAVSAIKKWKFKPYIKNGHPVKVLYKMPMDFAFRENVKDTPIPVENNSAVDKNPADASSRPANDSPNGNNLAGTKQVRISQGVSKGLLLHKVQPIYPYEAMRNHVEGTVLLRAVIDKDGRISSLEPISGPKELTAAAIGAVEQWRYRPYLLQGEPVAVETQITVNFQLR